ncbi:MAG: hypothetical protein U9N10_00705 [Bacillota bacterium]|nr:hypothetical protein [Bacillota bacterium]
MKKLNELKKVIVDEVQKKDNIEQAIKSLDNQIKNKLGQIADDNQNDSLLKDYRELTAKKEDEEIRLQAFNNKQSNLINLEKEVKEEYKQAEKDYYTKASKSRQKVKDLKIEFNKKIDEVKKDRENITHELNKHRMEVLKTVSDELDVKQIKHHMRHNSRDLNQFKGSEIR